MDQIQHNKLRQQRIPRCCLAHALRFGPYGFPMQPGSIRHTIPKPSSVQHRILSYPRSKARVEKKRLIKSRITNCKRNRVQCCEGRAEQTELRRNESDELTWVDSQVRNAVPIVNFNPNYIIQPIDHGDLAPGRPIFINSTVPEPIVYGNIVLYQPDVPRPLSPGLKPFKIPEDDVQPAVLVNKYAYYNNSKDTKNNTEGATEATKQHLVWRFVDKDLDIEMLDVSRMDPDKVVDVENAISASQKQDKSKKRKQEQVNGNSDISRKRREYGDRVQNNTFRKQQSQSGLQQIRLGQMQGQMRGQAQHGNGNHPSPQRGSWVQNRSQSDNGHNNSSQGGGHNRLRRHETQPHKRNQKQGGRRRENRDGNRNGNGN